MIIIESYNWRSLWFYVHFLYVLYHGISVIEVDNKPIYVLMIKNDVRGYSLI